MTARQIEIQTKMQETARNNKNSLSEEDLDRDDFGWDEFVCDELLCGEFTCDVVLSVNDAMDEKWLLSFGNEMNEFQLFTI